MPSSLVSVMVIGVACLMPQSTPAPVPAPPPSPAPAATPAPAPMSPQAPANAPAGAAPNTESLPLVAEPRVLDFGFVPPRQKSQGTFKLWNRGTEPLKIVRVEPDCKCTTLEDITNRTIEPGEHLDLRAELEAASVPQQRQSAIKVVFESSTGYQRVIEVALRSTVSLPVRALPAYLNVVEGKDKQGRIFIESIDKAPFRICSVQGLPPEFMYFDPAKDEPRSSYWLQWDVTKFGDKLPTHWIIETDHPSCHVLPVWIRHPTTIPNPVFRLKEYSVNLGRVEKNGSTEATIYMEDPGEQILTVGALSDSVTAELIGTERVEGGLHVKVRVTPVKDFEGMVLFPLVVYSPTREMEIPTFGVVRPAGGACSGNGTGP